MLKFKHLILSFFIWSTLIPYAAANEVVVPNDSDYFVFQKDNLYLVAPEAYMPYLPQTFEYMNEFVQRYTKSFNWTLDEKLYLVLASGNNQVANGFATVTPNLMTVFYPSGQLMLEEFAMYSWFLALTSHETAHLYQLNNKGSETNLNYKAKPYFRNTPLLVGPFGIPMFIHPNQFLPRFIVEGNAVMNESRLLKGGRLQSGRVRAITYALIKDKTIDYKFLLNETLDFPYGNEKYWFGGYLSAYLVEKYGVERTNQFFFTHGGEWFNPLMLRTPFINHFGESYAQALTNAMYRFAVEADKQVSSPEAPLTKGAMFGPMNHSKDQIYVLKSDALEERPKLVVYDKATGQITETKIDLAMGKVFKLDGRGDKNDWATATAASYKATRKAYGLYGPGLKVHREYLDKMVLDQRAGQTLTLDPIHSLLRNKISVNNQFWGESDSLPLLDEKGQVYDFVQDGTKRTLRKNQVALASFEAYDASLIEITDDGKVYFTGSTPYGSSLFVWNGKDIQRLSPSDTIVDAEIISDNKALVVETTSKGFTLKAIELNPVKGAPVAFVYKIKEDPLPTNKGQLTDLQFNKRRYNGLLEDWRFSRVTVFAPAISAGLGSLEAEFVDPLLYHAMTLGYSHGLDNSHNGAITYRYTRYLVNLLATAAYQEPITLNDKNEVIRHGHNRILGVGLQSTPWLQWRRWTSSAAVIGYYENQDYVEKKSLVSTLNLNYMRTYPRSYAPDRLLSLTYKNKVSSDLTSWTKDDSGNLGQLATNVNLGHQIFWSQTGSIASAEESSVKLQATSSLTGNYLEVQRLYDYYLTTRKLSAYRTGFLKSFYTPIYTTRFPVGLRRTAPYVEGQMLWLDRSRKIFEYQAGLQFETLLFQRIPLRAAISYANDDYRRQGGIQAQVAFQQTF